MSTLRADLAMRVPDMSMCVIRLAPAAIISRNARNATRSLAVTGRLREECFVHWTMGVVVGLTYIVKFTIFSSISTCLQNECDLTHHKTSNRCPKPVLAHDPMSWPRCNGTDSSPPSCHVYGSPSGCISGTDTEQHQPGRQSPGQ